MPVTQFANVKPMPDSPAADRMVSRHDNAPPLDEMIVIEFNELIAEHDQRIINFIAAADRAVTIADGDDNTAALYGEHVKKIATLVARIDAAHDQIKAPYLAADRALGARRNGIKGNLNEAKAKVQAVINDYARREDDKRQAEHERNMAEQRRLQAIANEKAEAERQRLQAIADEDAARERARLQQIENERAAAEAREVKVVEVEAEVVEVEAAEVQVVAVESFVARSDAGVRVGVKEDWHCAVENIRQVPDLYLKRPSVIEALTKEIQRDVRPKNGVRELKGVRIWRTVGGSVR